MGRENLNNVELREHILKTKDCESEKLYIPEWDCDVYVKQLSAREQDNFEANRFDKNGKEKIMGLRARFVANCLVDKDGNKIFSEDDIERLSDKRGSVLNRIIDKCVEVNRITEEDLERLAKN